MYSTISSGMIPSQTSTDTLLSLTSQLSLEASDSALSLSLLISFRRTANSYSSADCKLLFLSSFSNSNDFSSVCFDGLTLIEPNIFSIRSTSPKRKDLVTRVSALSLILRTASCREGKSFLSTDSSFFFLSSFSDRKETDSASCNGSNIFSISPISFCRKDVVETNDRLASDSALALSLLVSFRKKDNLKEDNLSSSSDSSFFFLSSIWDRNESDSALFNGAKMFSISSISSNKVSTSLFVSSPTRFEEGFLFICSSLSQLDSHRLRVR